MNSVGTTGLWFSDHNSWLENARSAYKNIDFNIDPILFCSILEYCVLCI